MPDNVRSTFSLSISGSDIIKEASKTVELYRRDLAALKKHEELEAQFGNAMPRMRGFADAAAIEARIDRVQSFCRYLDSTKIYELTTFDLAALGIFKVSTFEDGGLRVF